MWSGRRHSMGPHFTGAKLYRNKLKTPKSLLHLIGQPIAHKGLLVCLP